MEPVHTFFLTKLVRVQSLFLFMHIPGALKVKKIKFSGVEKKLRICESLGWKLIRKGNMAVL